MVAGAHAVTGWQITRRIETLARRAGMKEKFRLSVMTVLRMTVTDTIARRDISGERPSSRVASFHTNRAFFTFFTPGGRRRFR